MKQTIAFLCAGLFLPVVAQALSSNDIPAHLQQTVTGSNASTINVTQSLAAMTSRLRQQFDTWLKEPEVYRKKALRECSAFPEGRFYPFAIPALAYVNVGLSDEQQRDHCARQVRTLVDLLISVLVEDIKPPDGDLQHLTGYQNEGTRLATLNLTLAGYGLLSKDRHYQAVHDHVSLLLRRALSEKSGAPVASYPEYTWYFDTIMALVSLELHDRAQQRTGTRSLIDRHFDWIQRNATDPETGLPIAYSGGRPRGCDVSMQICLLQQVDPTAAQRLYQQFVAHHWTDLGFMAGFREWPRTKEETFVGDLDAGPVLLGIGATATGVGLGAAKAMNDTKRFGVLVRELELMPTLIQLSHQTARRVFGDQVPIDPGYLAGFMYGDAILFYAMTWTPYPADSK